VKNNVFVICVEETPELWVQQSAAWKQPVTCYDHVEPMGWRHLNVFNKECVIVTALPRGRRQQDGVVYRVTPPWEGRSKHFTKEFEAFALMLMREMPVKKAGEILRETDQRLWRMLHAHVEAARAKADWCEVAWIGADEMNRRKGHNYITVFADLVNRRVLFGTAGKDADVWKAFVEELEAHNGCAKAITQVAIDMSPAYQKGVRENLGNAEMVFDKFHVIQTLNEAVEAVRRLEAKQSEAKRQALEKSQWVFRKNMENHTDEQARRLDEMNRQNLMTVTAYQMRLAVQDIYQQPTERKARRDFSTWCEWVRQTATEQGVELLQPMVKAAEMIQRHIEGILAHWKAGLTTAFMEGLNSLFSATKRKARGYRTTKNLLTMLYFVAGKLHVPSY
jgi:transposase